VQTFFCYNLQNRGGHGCEPDSAGGLPGCQGKAPSWQLGSRVSQGWLTSGDFLRSSERFFIHDVRHFGRVTVVIAFENVDQSLYAAASHAFVWIDIQTCNLRPAGEMMEQSATIGDLGIKQWRIGRERLCFEYIERCARNDSFF
jgi:hypothetical protein